MHRPRRGREPGCPGQATDADVAAAPFSMRTVEPHVRIAYRTLDLRSPGGELASRFSALR
jgi:hypothetical protein